MRTLNPIKQFGRLFTGKATLKDLWDLRDPVSYSSNVLSTSIGSWLKFKSTSDKPTATVQTEFGL